MGGWPVKFALPRFRRNRNNQLFFPVIHIHAMEYVHALNGWVKFYQHNPAVYKVYDI